MQYFNNKKNRDIFLKELKSKKLVIFGASEKAIRIISNYLPDIHIAYFCENNQEKYGTKLHGIDILSPTVLENENADNIVIFITINQYEEVQQQLIKINENFDVFSIEVLTSSIVNDLYDSFLYNTFNKFSDELNVVVYGLKLQIMGGCLKYLERGSISYLVSPDLCVAGRKYFGYECKLPEMLVPYPKNTVVLVSFLYEYEYNMHLEKLAQLGIPKQNIVWVRSLSEVFLEICADYFAQNKMDLKVKELFDRIGKKAADIKYLDIGANNYSLYNNTYLFYIHGASGVLVEASPDFCSILRENRPRDILLNCGCSPNESKDKMIYYKTNRSGYNTFLPERISKVLDAHKDIELVDELLVEMKSITSIIDEYFPSKRIDYISIDIEGMGADVLNAIDLKRIDVSVILIEMSPKEQKSKELYMKLFELGYDMKYRDIGSSSDFLFYKKELIYPITQDYYFGN